MALTKRVDDSHDLTDIRASEGLDALLDEGIFDERECVTDMVGRDLAVDDILLEEREGITESSTSTFCDDSDRFSICLHSLTLCDVLESLHDILEHDLPEVEPESTRADGLRTFSISSSRG